MTSKHTPGPWHPDPECREVYSENWHLVARCNTNNAEMETDAWLGAKAKIIMKARGRGRR